MNTLYHNPFVRHLLFFVLAMYVSTNVCALSVSAAQSASRSATLSAVLEPSISPPPRGKGMNVTLSPVFLNLSAFAGKTVKSSIKISNNNGFAEKYVLSALRFKPDAKGESIIPVDADPSDDTLQWIKISKPEIVVQAKSSRIVEFEVSVPEYAFLGYYFGLSVKRSQEQFNRTDTTRMVAEAVMPILLEVKKQGQEGALFVDSGDNVYKQGEIASFNTSSWWYEYLPAGFEVKFKNTGKVHIVPFGNILIQQGTRDMGTLVFNASGGNTLPGATRTYKSEWTDGFIVNEPVKNGESLALDKNGNTQYKTVIHWDSLTKLRIGRYSAKAIVVYNNGRNDVPLEAQLSFWIIPWKIILVIALVLALVIFGIKNAIMGLIR